MAPLVRGYTLEFCFYVSLELRLCCDHFVYESGYITALAVAILNFLLSLTLDSIHNRTLEFLDPRNVGVAVDISFLVSQTVATLLHIIY